MFNIYSCEKKKKVLEKQLQEKEKEEKRKRIREKQMPQLITNYNNRIKSFIFEMVKTPFKIATDYGKKEKISTGHNLINEKLSKTDKKFHLKSFLTDKQRVESLFKASRNSTNFANLKRSQSEDISGAQFISSPSQTPSIFQPIMRYKPHTDIERLFDSINRNSYGRVSKSIVNEKLKKSLDSAKQKMVGQNLKDGFRINKFMWDYLLEKKKKIANIAENECHVKTHFKAASAISMNIHIPHRVTNTHSPIQKENIFDFSDDQNCLPTDYSIQTKQLDLNVSPFSKYKKSNETYDKQSLEYLKQLSISSNLKPNVKKNQLGFFSRLKEKKNPQVTSVLKTDPLAFFVNYYDNEMAMIGQVSGWIND